MKKLGKIFEAAVVQQTDQARELKPGLCCSAVFKAAGAHPHTNGMTAAGTTAYVSGCGLLTAGVWVTA